MGGSATVYGNKMPFTDYYSQPRRILTFAIAGNATLPAYSPPEFVPFDDEAFRSNTKAENQGAAIFGQYCATCHGLEAVGGGGAPDLRASAIVPSQEAFEQIGRGGNLVANGMPRFHELTDEQLDAIRTEEHTYELHSLIGTSYD